MLARPDGLASNNQRSSAASRVRAARTRGQISSTTAARRRLAVRQPRPSTDSPAGARTAPSTGLSVLCRGGRTLATAAGSHDPDRGAPLGAGKVSRSPPAGPGVGNAGGYVGNAVYGITTLRRHYRRRRRGPIRLAPVGNAATVVVTPSVGLRARSRGYRRGYGITDGATGLPTRQGGHGRGGRCDPPGPVVTEAATGPRLGAWPTDAVRPSVAGRPPALPTWVNWSWVP